MLSKKAAKLKKNIGSDTILLNQAIYSNFYFPFFLKKVYKSKKTTRQKILSKFSSKIIKFLEKIFNESIIITYFPIAFFKNQKKIRN
jgi:hypothetical protein